MDPLAALDEIALLLEGALASPYKSKAFRRARAALEGLDEAEIARRARSGALARMPGIGTTTSTVITQAVAGEVPEYLVALRERAGVSNRSGLLALLRGDLHQHSEWSDGTTPIATMAAAARAAGLEYLVCSDHSPSLRVANGLTAERLEAQLAEIATLNAGLDGIRLLPGIEVDILEDGTLDQSPEMLDRLDVVVASVHSKLRMDSAPMTRRMLRAIRDGRADVLGHCTGRLIRGSRGERPQSAFDARAVFAACAEHGVAVEVNSRPEREDPPDDLIALALSAGCLFSIDSDAHAPGHFGFLALGAARAEAAGIPPERIVNTWPVERLLEWSHRR